MFKGETGGMAGQTSRICQAGGLVSEPSSIRGVFIMFEAKLLMLGPIFSLRWRAVISGTFRSQYSSDTDQTLPLNRDLVC